MEKGFLLLELKMSVLHNLKNLHYATEIKKKNQPIGRTWIKGSLGEQNCPN